MFKERLKEVKDNWTPKLTKLLIIAAIGFAFDLLAVFMGFYLQPNFVPGYQHQLIDYWNLAILPLYIFGVPFLILKTTRMLAEIKVMDAVINSVPKHELFFIERKVNNENRPKS